MKFKLVSDNQPKGDQPEAIAQLVAGLNEDTKNQVLLGITGSGKSLLPEERILIGSIENGEIKSRLISIGRFIDEILAENQIYVTADKNEIVVSEQLSKKYFAFSIDPQTKQTGWKEIKSFIRHPSPEKIYHLQTNCGRRVKITGDHNFFVMREGNLELVETTEIKTGDFLPIPLSLPSPDSPLETVSVAEILRNEKIYAAVSPNLSARLKLSVEKKWRVKNRNESVLLGAIPLELSNELLLKGKKYSIPATFKITEDWLALIGMYIAEGTFFRPLFFDFSPRIRLASKSERRFD